MARLSKEVNTGDLNKGQGDDLLQDGSDSNAVVITIGVDARRTWIVGELLIDGTVVWVMDLIIADTLTLFILMFRMLTSRPRVTRNLHGEVSLLCTGLVERSLRKGSAVVSERKRRKKREKRKAEEFYRSRTGMRGASTTTTTLVDGFSELHFQFTYRSSSIGCTIGCIC
jgi:hypothetical protein